MSRFSRSLEIFSGLVLGLLLVWAPMASAANPVYVDSGSADCDGNGVVGISCFSSLQEGVDNAGPGVATVQVLAGTYAGVDISRMGSAIAAGPADLELAAFGDGVVAIEPTAGSRGIWNDLAPFPGSVVLRGLTVTSPDRDAIHLEEIAGDVLIDQVRAIDAGVDGLDVRSDGAVTLLDSNFDGNGNDGVEITSGGSIVIERCTANDNFGSVFVGTSGAQLGHDGFNLEVFAGDVTIIDSEARRNGGEGFEIHPVFDDTNDIYGRIDTVTISGCLAEQNGRRSGELPIQDSPDGFSDLLNDYPNNIMADGFQIESCDHRAPSPTGPCTIGDVDIRDSSAIDNTQDGFELVVYGDVILDTLVADRNGNLASGDGIDIKDPDPNSVTGRNILTTGNADDGIDVAALTFVLLEDVVADNNGKGIPEFHGFGPPPTGEDFFVPSPGADQGIELEGTLESTCRRCTARNNGGTGIQFEGSDELSFGDGLLASGNLKTGIEIESQGVVRCHNCYAIDNDEDGFHASAPIMEFIGCEASGSALEDGLDIDNLGFALELTVTDCRVQGNFEQGIIFSGSDDASTRFIASQVCAIGNRTGIEHQDQGHFTGDQIHSVDNTRYGLRFADRLGTTTVTQTNLEGNSLAGIFLDNLDAIVAAGGNWWGDASGPSAVGNPGGAGDAIIDGANGAGFGTVQFAPPSASAFTDIAELCAPDRLGPPISGTADLSITKTVDLIEADPGDTLIYTIVVHNPGPLPAFETAVIDAVPAGLVGVTWTCTASFGSVCTPAGVDGILDTVEILPAGTLTYTVVGEVASNFTGELENVATVASAPGVTDPVDSNNSSATSTAVLATIDVPALGDWGLVTLLCLLVSMALWRIRR